MKLDQWINELETHSTKHNIVTMLVGNKIDKVTCQNSFVGICIDIRRLIKERYAHFLTVMKTG